MNYSDLICSLYQINAIKFGSFTLKSGQSSKIYLDLRQIVSYPDVLRNVASAMWNLVQHCQIDLVCGVPYTALPIATCLSLQHNIPMIMRRKEKKEYGTKQQIEGKFSTGQRCLIIEDVITSGGSIIETADELENAGLVIEDLVVLIDRQQGGKENLQKRHFNVHAVFKLPEIMQQLLKTNLLSSAEKDIVTTLI